MVDLHRPGPMVIVEDMPNGGVIPATAQAVFDARWVIIRQTTEDQVIVLPDLYGVTGPTGTYIVTVRNIGSAQFDVLGIPIPNYGPGAARDFAWHDVAWLPVGTGFSGSSGSAVAVSVPGRTSTLLNPILIEMDTDIVSNKNEITGVENHNFVADLNL